MPVPTTGTARASTVGQEETYHVGPLVPRRADGREARCPTGPQYERDVPRARRHAYRALRPGGRPGVGVPGWLTAPTARQTWGGGPVSQPQPCPCWSTRPNTRRRRPLLSHRAHLGHLPAHIPSPSGPRVRERPTRAKVVQTTPWAAPKSMVGATLWHTPDDGNCLGRGPLRGDRPRSRSMETPLAPATCGAQGQGPPRPEMGTPYGRVTCHD